MNWRKPTLLNKCGANGAVVRTAKESPQNKSSTFSLRKVLPHLRHPMVVKITARCWSTKSRGKPGKALMPSIHLFWYLQPSTTTGSCGFSTKKIKVELSVDMRISISDRERIDHNVLGELPGTGDEVVLIGAHLDANSAGTGATDNASGVTAVMEAMRILKQIGVKPKRTIRAALWGGEEYGLLGSKKYIEKHFGGTEQTSVKRDHKKLAIYFNKDGGGGRIRGIQLQGNEQLRHILSDWLQPLHPLGVAHLTSQVSRNSDHAPFNAAGLPAVSFLGDPVERRAYHTNMDTYDRFVPEDLVQSAVVMAVLAYHAAMYETKIPRMEN